jgi:ribosomal protein S18 acetylase RimI-like enzyme
MLTAKFVTKDEELIQIARLSADNLVSNISNEIKEKEGFVTWVYSVDTLFSLHAIAPSIIVKDGDAVVGYALVMTKECAAIYPSLRETIEHASTISYKGKPLTAHRVYFMGQICVHADYRGQGLVGMLYEFHRQKLSAQYDILVTEISTNNPRSLRAHLKTGFKVIDKYRDVQDEWEVVIWDWTSNEERCDDQVGN